MLSSLRARGAAAVAVVALGASATAFAFSHHGSTATAATPSTARGAPPSGGAGPRGGPAGGGYATDLKTAAAYLGLSTDELQTKFRSGTTLAALAKAEGRTTAGLVEAILTAERKGMTASQRAQSAATLRRRIEQLVTSNRPSAGAGRPPQGMAAAP